MAMFLIFSKVGSLDYLTVFHNKDLLAGGAATAAVLLLFLAVTGKSAQIPLFNWLPDAMEGPTPVSALIHAATMVTAGVYLLCRVNPLLELSPDATWVIAVIGGLTAFVAAAIACTQQDIKKVLAFSTVSQIGYMVLAVGCGAYIAAIFLMVCHAFYKGLLFLGSGSVIHGLEDEQDLKRMGALRRWLPWTFGTFIVGWLAIAGVPPLSGFWSKGDVLDNVFAKSPVLWVFGLLTALGTAYYISRLFYLTFTGEARWQSPAPDGRPAHHTPHESPWVMRIPLVVLAFFAAAAGLFDLPWARHDSFVGWLTPVFATSIYSPHQGDTLQWVLGITDAVVAVIGLTVAWVLWRRRTDRPALEPIFLQRVVLGRVLRHRHRPAGAGPGPLQRGGGRRPGDRRRGQRRGLPREGDRQRGPPAPDRLRPQLRPGHRPRAGRHHRLHDQPGVVVVTSGFPYLTVLVLLPAAGALVVALMAGAARKALEAVGLAVALGTLGLAIAVAVLFHTHDAGYQFVTDHQWAPGLGIRWFLGLDGISLFLVLLAAVLFPIVLAGARTRQDPRSFIAWMLLLEAACIGSFVSLDLILFFFFFELTLVPSYFIISGWGYAGAPTPPSSSSSTPSSARPSCWSASWPWPSSTSTRPGC